jgi:transcriptional regulator
MYRPAAFDIDLARALAFVDGHPLAQLVALGGDGLVATPVPLIRRGSALVGHLARPNPVVRHPGPALAIFSEGGAYVSPRWYEAKAIDGKVVPTWNYTAVHAHGRLVVHDDPEWVGAVVRLLTERFEAGFDEPWAVSDAPTDWLDALARGIVGIEVVDIRIDAKAKLSQNRSLPDRHRISTGLSTGTAEERAVADAMRDLGATRSEVPHSPPPA